MAYLRPGSSDASIPAGSAKVGSRHESQFDSGVLPSAGTDDFGRNSRAPTPEPQPPGLDPLEVNSPVPKGSAGLEGLPAEPQRSTESTGVSVNDPTPSLVQVVLYWPFASLMNA